jgi:hypothetical protein
MHHETQHHQLGESFYQCNLPECGAKLKDPESVHIHQRKKKNATILEAMQCSLTPQGTLSNGEFKSQLRFLKGCDLCAYCTKRPCDYCILLGRVCGKGKLQLSTTCGFDLR